jgi:hypothetical protein
MNCDSNAYSQIPHKLLQDCDRKPQKKQNKTKQNKTKQNKTLQNYLSMLN